MDKESVERKRTDGLSIELVVEANPEEASRSAIITIIGGQAKQQVEVVQAGLSSLKRITIVHSNRMFSIPRFRGSDLTGLINGVTGSRKSTPMAAAILILPIRLIPWWWE